MRIIKTITPYFFLLLLTVLSIKSFSKSKVEPLSLDGTIKPVTGCYGESNAFIKVYAIGGTPDYIYTIDNWANSQTSGDFLDLPAGNYEVKVRDADNTEASMYIEITQPEEFHLSGQKQNVTACFGDKNGKISLSASGGSEPYAYSIDNGLTYFESGTFTELAADYYQVTAKDKNNCSKSFNLDISQPDELVITNLLENDVFPCFDDNNGSLEIVAEGGTGTLSYSINGSDFFQTASFQDIPNGNFIAYAKDENNCQTQSVFTINQPEELILDTIFTTDLSCYNSADGAIKIQAQGGTSPLSYSIDNLNFQTNELFESLSAGNYTITISDKNSCKQTKTVSLSQADELIVYESHENLKCYGDNSGSIALNAIGGSGNYEFSINSGSSFQNNSIFTSLSAKSYSVIVKDKDNCKKNSIITLTQPSIIHFDSINSNNLECNGDSTAFISIFAKGGTGTLFYSIDNGLNFQNNSVFNDLKADYYQIVVKDENSCKQNNSATINEPIFNVEASKTDIDCFGNNNGIISFSTFGSYPPFKFSLDDGTNFQEVTVFINLEAGNYSAIVEDQKRCRKKFAIEITQPEKLVLNEAINSGCNNGDDVSIEMNAEGGTTSYKYSIDDGATYQSNNLFQNLNIGTYNLKLLDGHSCSVSKTISIENPQLIMLSAEKKDLICYNDKSGEIDFKVKGGVSPYNFSIDYGLNFQTDSIFKNLKAQNYYLMVKDKNNCQTSSQITINQPDKLNLILEKITHIEKCFGENTGSFSVTSTGGRGEILYSIDFENFQTTGTFSNLIANSYKLLAKDTNNCQSSLTIEITQPELLKIEELQKTDISSCFGDQTGEIKINISGGSLPFLFSIDDGENYQASPQFTNLSAGNYYIRVKDSKLCAAESSIELTEPEELILSSDKENISCYGETDGKIELWGSGGTGNLQYSIDNGINFTKNQSFTSLEKGTYSLICKDDNNCLTPNQTVYISEPENLIFSLIEKTDLQCDRINGGIIAVGTSGGTGNILYSIDGNLQQSDSIFTNLSAGNHQIEIEDENYCTHTKTIELLASDANCIDIPTAFTPNEDGINDTWEVQHLDLYPNAWVQIYDRNGNTITRYKSGETGWNGTFNNNPMPMGSYWYRIKLAKDSDLISGYLTLIR